MIGKTGLALMFLTMPGMADAACSPLSLCSCTVSATSVAFGNVNPVSPSNVDATGDIRVTCTLLLALAGSYTIDLSSGSSASYNPRTMKNGASTLQYNLYTNAARSQVWGNGTGGSVAVTNNFSALLAVDQTTPVYGRIPAGQNVPAGTYSDTIVVTVTF
ncbi:spore coat U domain-containing protein [Sphingobium sp. H39-3-25]|uniref:Csu type fimbrial protein n=1 Tax=Sphingobium arseniciresistens TaxID=3030834 RepID=UPI0023B9CC00|nr:spore coat U domain-containing protein [Sphingobium arseniciresistens]